MQQSILLLVPWFRQKKSVFSLIFTCSNYKHCESFTMKISKTNFKSITSRISQKLSSQITQNELKIFSTDFIFRHQKILLTTSMPGWIQTRVFTGRPGTNRDGTSHCPFVPGQKKIPCPAVPLSRNKSSIKNSRRNSSVLGRPGTKKSKNCKKIAFF